jgi:site-specific DNA-methyltransferase (adenine-specific)
MVVIVSDPYFETDLGKLYKGDSLEVLPTLPTKSYDLIFADPPFNLDKDYGSGVKDKMGEDDYVSWCRDWIAACVPLLAPGGSFWIYNLPKWNIELGHELNRHGLMFRHWVAIDMKMSLPIQGKLYPSHYSLLYYSDGRPRVFNRPRVPIPLCRHCGGDIKDYGGHRNKLHPEGLNLSDVWNDIAPVRHARTKTRSANQLNEKMLERVLTIGSEVGDRVLDPFGGSGTTFAVAERMHRHWTGIELGDCEPIAQRLRGEDIVVEMPGLGDSGKRVQAVR